MNTVLGLFLLILLPAVANAEIDWTLAPAKKVSLLYTGMTSWEYLTGADHSSGGNAVARGEKSCQDCHVKQGRFDIFANDILSGKLRIKSKNIAFEPEPPQGIAGFKETEFQAAYDAANLYLKIKWPSAEGASFKDPSLEAKGLSDKVAIQLNGNLKSFSKTGCFMACHDDVSFMPETPSETEVAEHPFYAGQKRKDVRLYAYFTRTRGWANLKPEQEMAKYLKAGGFIDLWVAGFKGSDIFTSDESIFYDRNRDSSQDLTAEGGWQNGFYTIVIKRSLTTQDHLDIQFQEGKTVTIGVAVYDNKNGGRKHYVSFPITVGIGKEADITAVKIEEAVKDIPAERSKEGN